MTPDLRRFPAGRRSAATRWILLGALVVGLGIPADGADDSPFEPAITIGHINRQQGLSHFTVTDVLQDRLGFMWFATYDGLDRFDGHDFSHYRHDPSDPASLSNNRVNCLLEASDGALWVGTDSGIDRLRDDTGGFTHYLPSPPDGTHGRRNRITDLAEDKMGHILIATYSGVYRLDPVRGSIVQLGEKGLKNDDIFCLLPDVDGHVLVGTAFGLEGVGPSESKFLAVPLGPVHAIVPDQDGTYWIGTEGRGLVHLDPAARDRRDLSAVSPAALAGVAVRDLDLTSDRVLWVATGSGLFRYDLATGKLLAFRPDSADPTSLSHVNVTSVFVGGDGIVWASTWGGGVNRLDDRSTRIERSCLHRNSGLSLSDDEVMTIAEDRRGTLWVGTWNGGLHRLDAGAKDWTIYRADPSRPGSLGSDRVTALYEDRQGRFWVGTRGGGINLLDRDSGRFTVYAQDLDPEARVHMIHAITEDRSGILWLGTSGGGLVRFDPERLVFRTYTYDPTTPGGMEDDDAWDLLVDGDRLWIATSAGLHRLDLVRDEFTVYRSDPRDPTTLPNNRISCLAKDPEGRLWVGTEAGVAIETAEGRFRRLPTADGSISEHVRSIVFDHAGRPWVATDVGLSRIDSGRVLTIPSSAGIQPSGYFENSALCAADGHLYFGGFNGLTRFEPDDVTILPPPRLAVTRFLLGGRPVPLSSPERPTPLTEPIWDGGTLEIGHSQTPVEFDFTALSFSDPDRQRFAYRLRPADTNWIVTDANNRRANYHQLPPGHYTLDLRGANADGVWSERTAILKLVVRRPWWATWWARGIAVALLAALVVGVHRFRLLRLERIRQMLEETVEMRTRELRAANEKLATMSRTDELTGLPNRRGFLELADREIVASRRSLEPYVIGIGDLDHFKRINDSYGHAVGDRTLGLVAAAIRKTLRERDVAGRWGGEEFIFFFPGTHIAGARVIAERVRAAVAEVEIPAGGGVISVNLTIGLAAGHPDETFESGLSRADAALYRGKDEGRDRVAVAD